jgi:hypothetical protein
VVPFQRRAHGGHVHMADESQRLLAINFDLGVTLAGTHGHLISRNIVL